MLNEQTFTANSFTMNRSPEANSNLLTLEIEVRSVN